jgi:hypothetical protein
MRHTDRQEPEHRPKAEEEKEEARQAIREHRMRLLNELADYINDVDPAAPLQAAIQSAALEILARGAAVPAPADSSADHEIQVRFYIPIPQPLHQVLNNQHLHHIKDMLRTHFPGAIIQATIDLTLSKTTVSEVVENMGARVSCTLRYEAVM